MSETKEAESAEEETNEKEELRFDAVDLMLEGNLQAQINYSMVKAVAAALDEKAQLLIQAESSYEPIEDESFAEAAMPEIEAMAKAVLEGCVDFSKIRFWEACETAEIAWEDSEDQEGNSIKLPYSNSLDSPKPGNRILANLEQIHKWLESVHGAHEKNGMGWVSPYGCPEDGQHAFEARQQSLKRLDDLITAIKSNFDF